MKKHLTKVLSIVLVVIMSTLILSGCGSDSANISDTKWYMVMAGSTYGLDIKGDGTADMYIYDYKGDMTQNSVLTWKSVGKDEYQFSGGLDLSVKVYDMNESGFTSTQILEMGMDGYCLYFTQNEDDAQLLFNAYGGMKPDFLE